MPHYAHHNVHVLQFPPVKLSYGNHRMSFEETEGGIECETVNHEMYYIAFDIIQSISIYKNDLFSGEEHRLEIETSDYEIYTFSEREDCWIDLIAWVQRWANLPEDWEHTAFAEAFPNEITVLWQNTA